MKVSVVVPTYNRERTLGPTIESLVAQTFDDDQYEIIVVDNNSNDSTPAVVSRLQTSSPVAIRYLHEPRSGVHYARNRAAAEARAKTLYFTDDDMLADPPMLAALYRMFEIDDRVAVATGRVLPKFEIEPPEWILKYCLNGKLSLQLRTEELIISQDDPGVWSCHEMIDRDVLIACGGFHPENTEGLWVGDGESGLNAKIAARGHRFAFTSDAITHHVIPAGRLTQEYMNRRMENQGNSDAFTWFRANRPNDAQMAEHQKHCRRQALRARLSSAVHRMRRYDWWHMRKADESYWKARHEYVQKLRQDPQWRTFVLRDDWMEVAAQTASTARG
jgi:glycosyltransferase involved in cell wall biosynthesis